MSQPEIVRHILVKRVKAGSLFKLVFIVTAATLGVFILGCGIAALFGASTITIGNGHVTGILGLVASLFMIPIFSAIVGGINWVFVYVGIRMVGRFYPFRIEYVAAEEPDPLPPPMPTAATPPAGQEPSQL